MLFGNAVGGFKFGELAELAVDFNRATVLLGDDVIGDRQTEPGPLAGRLGRHKGLEQFVPYLRRDTGAVVAHPHFDSVAEARAGAVGQVLCATIAAEIGDNVLSKDYTERND